MHISDDKLAGVLHGYVRVAARTLADTERWATLGEAAPGSPQWQDLTPDQRSAWWVRRIGVIAGIAAAAPRYAGALADRLPLQGTLGAAAAGLAVCAVAREHGCTDPDEWVPLLGRVLFARDLPTRPMPAPDDDGLADADADAGADGDGVDSEGAGRRAARTLWRLARTFSAVSDLLDERPRGGLLARGVAKVPVIGVAGGFFDERGAIRKAAEQTAALLV